MKTVSLRSQDVERAWYVVDLEGQTLGRAAAKIAAVLRGKHKPSFTPNADTGDFVIAINADKVVLTSRKLEQKMYYRHSQYPGGIRAESAAQVLEKHPERLIQSAVKGMLPKNSLGRKQFMKFKVYAGPEHPHAAQTPVELKVA